MNVYYLSLKKNIPCNDYWDYGLINDTFKKLNCKTHEVRQLPQTDRAIVVVAARHHTDAFDQLNLELLKIDRVVLFLMGDEERLFRDDKIKHPNIEIWLQNPHVDKDDNKQRIGTGYAPHPQLKRCDKTVDLFFSGQITHRRRREMLEAVQQYELINNNVDLNATRSFTSGYSSEDYYSRMLRAKVAPAPSGAVIQDSFRLFEALETMCVPIADEVSPSGAVGYWDWLFEEITPFVKIQNWEDLSAKMQEILDEYPENMHRITAWWIKYKRNFKNKLVEQYNA